MADPSQQPTRPPQSAWVRLCQWLWNQQGFLWGTVILGVALNLFASWLITPWGSTFSNTPLGTILGHPLLFALGGSGLLGLTGGLWIVNRRYPARLSQQTSPRPLTQRDRQELVHFLRQEYRRRLAQSLQGAVMMMLGLHERMDVTFSSAQSVFRRTTVAEEHEQPFPSGTSIVQAFDEAGWGLLILGEAGTGKTTLLLDLARALLTRAEDDPMYPIAVVLNLSSWATRKLSLADWVIDQVQLVYGVPPRLGQAWLKHDQWLLLLDGLDEVEASARSACIEAINTYRGEHLVPLVVCSRSEEYLSQEARLALPTAVVVQPLQKQQVTDYLRRVGKPVAAVQHVLRNNLSLRELITTPLMLNVVILTYRDKAVKDLPQLGSAEEQQQQIFEHYIARMLARRTSRGEFAPQQTRRWLTWLAQQMKQHDLTEFYLEDLQPTWLPTKRSQSLYRILSVLLVVLVFGLLGLLSGVGLGVGLLGVLSGVGLGLGLGLGLLVGLLVGWLDTEYSRIMNTPQKIFYHAPQLIIKRSWKDTNTKLYLVVGLLFGLVVGLVAGLVRGLVVGLLFGLVGLVGGLGGCVLVVMLVIMSLVGLVELLVAGLVDGLSAGFFIVLLILLLGAVSAWLGDEGLRGNPSALGPRGGVFGEGLPGGLVADVAKQLQYYGLRYLLWRSGAMSWHYVRFLEEATERILLQRIAVGYRFIQPSVGYRFIHPLFQEYFASLGTRTPANT